MELLLPNLGTEGQMQVELFVPFCRGLHEANARLGPEQPQFVQTIEPGYQPSGLVMFCKQ